MVIKSMNKSSLTLLAVILFTGNSLFNFSLIAIPDNNDSKVDNGTKNNGKPSKAEYKIIKPQKKDIKVTLTLNGYLDDPESVPYGINTTSWLELKVIDPPLHGSLIKKNSPLLSLDLEKIKKKLSDMVYELEILNIDQEILTNELKREEEIRKIEINETNRAVKYAEKNFSHFNNIALPLEKKSADFELKRYEENLSYMLEELNQLKKMYESDDLTEETEEIIITRTQNDVNRYKFALEEAKVRRDKRLSLEIPNMVSEKEDSFRKQQFNIAAKKKIRPLEIKRKRLELEKVRENKKRLSNEMKEIEKDLIEMKALSPISGTIFVGKFDRGQWSGSKPFEQKLKRGGVLKPLEEFITICPLNKIQARINLPEKDFPDVIKINSGKLTTSINPEKEIECEIKQISKFQVSPGNYEIILDVNIPDEHKDLKPGNSCKFKVVTYQKNNAITLPSSSVFSEDHDPEIRFVYILSAKNKPVKKIVKTGKTIGTIVEILRGVSPSHKILHNKPS